MGTIIEMVAGFDWSPFWISLKTGIVATIICFFLGIFAARKVLRLGPKARAAVDGVLTLPMVLAPTVAGFFLLLLFSLRRPLGAFLFGTFGIKVVQTWLGCIIAASVIAFPLMYRNARAAFEQIDPDLVYAARTLGMSEFRLFWKVVLPAAGPGIASGTVLTFARALGDTEVLSLPVLASELQAADAPELAPEYEPYPPPRSDPRMDIPDESEEPSPVPVDVEGVVVVAGAVC